MDFIKQVTGEGNKNPQEKKEGSSGGGGFLDRINSMAGGGKESEKQEDGLDKAVDLVQEHAFGQGDQSNESAVEQAKDEQISDMIRDKYKEATGKDFLVADKKKDYGS